MSKGRLECSPVPGSPWPHLGLTNRQRIAAPQAGRPGRGSAATSAASRSQNSAADHLCR